MCAFRQVCTGETELHVSSAADSSYFQMKHDSGDAHSAGTDTSSLFISLKFVSLAQMASTVTTSQSSRAPLGCGKWEIHIVDVKSPRNVSSTSLNLRHEEREQFWRKNVSDLY